jgi:glyoxylase-like metal-dependent hydrolase (beta-lactamase superfamily II)
LDLPIADHWFSRKRVSDDITLLWEPYVVHTVRCNIWHVQGRDSDALIDTGMGIASLAEASRDLFQKPLHAVATHYHFDHVGGFHEFDRRVMHHLEAAEMADYQEWAKLDGTDLREDVVGLVDDPEREFPDLLITAAPHENYQPDDYQVRSASPTRTVDEGDVIDLGDRFFEVLHLPGHSHGSIGLWEQATGTLFSGDAIYDNYLLDELPESDIAAYIRTMKRLRELPVNVVHGGHAPSFGRERLVELIDAYLRWRDV